MLTRRLTLVSLSLALTLLAAAPPPDKPLLDSVTEHFAAARPGTVPRIPASLFLQVASNTRDQEHISLTNCQKFPPLLVSCIIVAALCLVIVIVAQCDIDCIRSRRERERERERRLPQIGQSRPLPARRSSISQPTPVWLSAAQLTPAQTPPLSRIFPQLRE